MSRIQRNNTSISTLQIIAAAVIILLVLVGLAFFMAQRKPEAPPKSKITYQEAPTEKPKARPSGNDEPFVPVPSPTPASAASTDEPAADAATAAASETPYRITGIVINAEDKAPLAMARVAAVRMPSLGEPPPPPKPGGGADADPSNLGFATTKEDGSYELVLMKPGIYSVEFIANGFINAKKVSEALTLEQPVRELNAEMNSGASVSGRVKVSGSSEGAPDLKVYVEQGPETKTDADGRYDLVGLAPGEAGVMVELRGSEFVPGKELPFQKVKIATDRDHVKNVDFEVDVAGIVWGYVTTGDKLPVPNADVVLCTSDSPLSQALNSMVKQAPPLSNRSGEDGYYELRGVPLNQPWRLYATCKESSPQLADPFLLTKDQRSVRIDVFMFSGSNVFGVVRDDKGEVVPDADIACIPQYSKLLSPVEAPQAFRGARSDETGQFTITQLPPGEYQLFARKKGFKIAAMGYPIYPDGYSDMKVELTLSSADDGNYAVFGVVKDNVGAAVDGANIKLSGMSGATFDGMERSTTSSGGGKFNFDGVNTGYYSLEVSKEGFAPTTVRRVRLNEAIEVVLKQTATIRGFVTARDTGRAPATYTVDAYPMTAGGEGRLDMMSMMSGATNSMTFSNPDGSFEMRVNAGAYRLEAKAEGYAPARAEVEVQAGQVMDDVKLVLDDRGGTISGTVYAGDGASVQGAEVTVIEASTPAEAMMLLPTAQSASAQQVGADGTFLFENLAAGSYVVVAKHPRYATGTSEMIELAQGGKRENVRVRLGTGGGVEGYVFREGKPSVGAVVMVAGNGATKSATTDQTGHYMVDGLATGTYQAMVTEISSGDISSIYGARGLQVTVTEGQTARCDFGSQTGARIEGQCIPGPSSMLGGRVVLHMPGGGPVPLGGMADITQLMGQSTGVTPMGNFTLEDVPQGDWQLDVYYFELGGANPLQVRYVHTELVTVAESQVIPLTLNIMNF